jgi:transcriptional regulator with XRE-family HTH domain
VRALRRVRSLSQERLAHLTGLDRTYISGVERGIRNPSLRNIAVLARSLDVTIQELFEGI